MSVYQCSSCSNSYCNDCDPPLTCYICKEEICKECENSSTYSDYIHKVICQSCFSDAPKKKQEEYIKNKSTGAFIELPTKLKSKKIEINQKMTVEEINKKLQNIKQYTSKNE